jgi:hypothetical protein
MMIKHVQQSSISFEVSRDVVSVQSVKDADVNRITISCDGPPENLRSGIIELCLAMDKAVK